MSRTTGGPMGCAIVPPHLLRRLGERGDERVATAARATLEVDEQTRARRGSPGRAGDDGVRRVVHDCAHDTDLPGRVVRREDEPATGDHAADEAYFGLGATWRLYHEVYGRDSIDGRGLPLVASVHYGRDYDNAMWDGSQMVFGDGDGEVFRRFTRSVDVIGHELTHGVVQSVGGLTYQGQSGALNESVADAFGSLVKQRHLRQDADGADWLIGAELFTDAVQGKALRSMQHPGTAYDDDVLGADPQPAHMDDYVETTDDNGGVHLNSGIPNRAFVLAAIGIGGRSADGAGRVWYDVLTDGHLPSDCDFARFAELTTHAARRRYGDDSREAGAVGDAWRTVGVGG